MQIDFHYYCIAVLAKAAGFNKRDALTIAYASQYVDDATESELIRLDVPGGDLRFDPVRTAYDGMDIIGALGWSAQKRVYIPFHFLPPRPFYPKESESFLFVTRPAIGEQNRGKESFAQLLLKEAARESRRNHRRRLCRIGIVMHTFADTWAHQGFSGRHSRIENDVESIHEWDGDSYQHLLLENIIFDPLPQIGHAEAGYYPDLSYQKWKYDSRQSPTSVERDNLAEFLKAAGAIYGALVPIPKTRPDEPIPWNTIAPKIRQLLAGGPIAEALPPAALTMQTYRHYHAVDLKERCKQWQQVFSYLFEGEEYAYNRRLWRDAALKGDTDWDGWSQREWDRMLPLGLRPDFWNSLWVHFHRAALQQRHFVLEHMP